jgi:hypothetical protein
MYHMSRDSLLMISALVAGNMNPEEISITKTSPDVSQQRESTIGSTL